MKQTIIIIVLAVVAWLYVKEKKAANPSGKKSESLFGESGVVEGLSLISYEGSSSSDSTTSTTSTTTSTTSASGLHPPRAAFTLKRKAKSPFKWRNLEK